MDIVDKCWLLVISFGIILPNILAIAYHDPFGKPYERGSVKGRHTLWNTAQMNEGRGHYISESIESNRNWVSEVRETYV